MSLINKLGSLQQVVQGTATLANTTIVLTNGLASVNFNLAGTPQNYQGNRISVRDSALREVIGYIGVNGVGTASKIFSTKGGTTQNWAFQNGSFNIADASGYTYAIYKDNAAVVVASGSYAAGGGHLSLVDGGVTASGGAFADIQGADLSPYADGRYLLAAYDSSGRAAIGYIKSVGGGQTLEAAKGLTGITKANPGVITFNAGHGYVNGNLIYLSGLTQMTELNTTYRSLMGNVGDTFTINNTSGYGAAETTGGNCAQKVLTPSATGVVITNTKGGSIYNWLTKDAAFDPNTSGTYKVYFLGD